MYIGNNIYRHCAIILIIVSCQSLVLPLLAGGAAETVQKYCSFFNPGDKASLKDFQKCFVPGERVHIKEMPAQEQRKNYPIGDVTIVDEEYHGTFCTVRYRMENRDREEVLCLRKIDGKWLISNVQTAAALKKLRRAQATGEHVKWQKGPNQNWFIDWNHALAEARIKNKAIFVLSTGSDWCGWCKKLRSNVLDKKRFLDYADKHLVLLYLDSPHKIKLDPDQQQHNAYIRQALEVGNGVPKVVIVSHQGHLLGKIIGGGLTLDEYLEKLNEIINSRGSAINSQRGKDLFTKGYLTRNTSTIKDDEKNNGPRQETPNVGTPASSPHETITKEAFKAEIVGIAVADFHDNKEDLEYLSPDTHINVPYGMIVVFKVQYDFPDDCSAYIWTRSVENISGMGSNPSGLHNGKGVAFGFLTHPGKKAHMNHVKIDTSSPQIMNVRGWILSTRKVDVDFE